MSICARGADALDETRDEIAALGHKAHAAACDLADADAIARYIAAAAEALGGIDILVNNASGFGTTDDEAGWAASIEVDLMATVRATRAALPFLEQSERRRDHQHLVDLGLPAPRRARRPTARSRRRSSNTRRHQAAALAHKGIRVNCIAPGLDRVSRRHLGAAKANNPQLYDAILRCIPFGRLGHPEEVARVALFLASPLANWVTGQTISVDGGQLLGN